MDRKLRDIMEQELVGASPPSARDLVAGAVLRGTRMRRRRRLSVGGSAAAVVLAAASAVAMLHLPPAGRTDAPATAATSSIDSAKTAGIGGKIYLIMEQVSECHEPADDTPPARTGPELISVALPATMPAQQRDTVAAAVQASPLVQSNRTEEGSDIPDRYRQFSLYGPGHEPVEMVVRLVVTLKDPSTFDSLGDELKGVGDVGLIGLGSCAEPTGAGDK